MARFFVRLSWDERRSGWRRLASARIANCCAILLLRATKYRRLFTQSATTGFELSA
ncbi:hypothetical protein [Rhizobium sp. C4]|uniref:hypothetical protein n=1 Tax=Rhizobium sp. C4 TaxID=1349800 RepID=UPI001E604E3A|nr:hypothetical protein [Rhizobium sp. C4]MCD2173652.1 hypothetical protein [Rhizobium sp. C4]